MRAWMCLAAVSVLIGAAFAQETAPPPAPQTKEAPAAQTKISLPPAASTAPAQVKTQSYKGTLVDASCATTAGAPATANPSSSAPAPAGCAVSASTKQFALRTDDGHVVRFDMVGNERMQQALKDKKKWSDAVAAGKTLHVKASGMLSGDTLTVVSVD